MTKFYNKIHSRSSFKTINNQINKDKPRLYSLGWFFDLLINSIYKPGRYVKPKLPVIVSDKFINKAYEVVEQNLDNADFEANDFAAAMGISRAQLYRKIHAISGQSVKEFIRVIRLKKGAEMLTNSDHNISEVAYAVGFNSVAYFTKSFNEYFGMTPSKYISKHKQYVS